MLGKVECHGVGSDFAPVAHILCARGFELSSTLAPRAAPMVKAGGAMILWQSVDDPAARVRAFEAGAQDVVGPWMHEAETVARIVRLAHGDQPRLVLGDLVIRLVDRTVARAGRTVDLLAREYALLLHLAHRAGEPVSRDELLRNVWRLHFDPGTKQRRSPYVPVARQAGPRFQAAHAANGKGAGLYAGGRALIIRAAAAAGLIAGRRRRS